QPVRSDAGARHPQPGPGRAVRQPHDRARRRPDRRRRRRGGTAVRAAPVFRAVSGGVTRRKVQTVVIFTVLLVSTASATLGLGLLLDSNDPFHQASAARGGAEWTASIDAAKVTAGQLAATRRLPQVTAAAGPSAISLMRDAGVDRESGCARRSRPTGKSPTAIPMCSTQPT